MNPPLLGITIDNSGDGSWPGGKYESPIRYSNLITQAGGIPVLMAQEESLAARYADICDGFLLTGGDDPRMELLGKGPTHSQAKVMAESRQRFEWALLAELEKHPAKPVLGICLGMQMMALYHGGELHQHLPEVLGEAQAESHRGKKVHEVKLAGGMWDAKETTSTGQVVSSHHQAVSQAGKMEVVGTSGDGVIEAVWLRGRRWYGGVQWHPELGGDEAWNRGLFTRLVQEAKEHEK